MQVDYVNIFKRTNYKSELYSGERTQSTISMDISGDCKRSAVSRRILVTTLLIVGIAVSYWAVYSSAYSSYSIQFLPRSSSSSRVNSNPGNIFDLDLYRVLEKASTKNKTVIITTVNQAWAEPNSLLDLFLESIRTGNGTRRHLNNLVIVSVDHKAYNRCLTVHPHCHKLSITEDNDSNEAYFMTANYMKIVWKKIDFLRTVLEMGFNFLFTDCDIMWLQDPFPRFFPDADIQTSCDNFLGDSYSQKNWPNTGFHYVKSNDRTIVFYKFWYSSRFVYPGRHDQDVFNQVRKHPFIAEIGLKFIFLDTLYFGGFCQPGKDIKVACTMHANCCFGLLHKINDLKLVLEDFRNFSSFPPSEKPKPNNTSPSPWRVPQQCSIKRYNPPKPPMKNN